MARRERGRRSALTAALALLVACGAGERPGADPATVQPSAFAGGTCLVLAEDLVVLRAFAAQAVAEGLSVAPGDAAFLREQAARFRQGLRLARPPVTGALTAFVAGLEALGAPGGGGPDGLRRLRDRADDLVAACT